MVMRVSPDGVFGGIFVQNEILIYRFMEPNGNLLPEKISSRAVETHRVNHPTFHKMQDLYIFKNDHADYQMYVLFEEGILLYNSIDRRTEPHKVYDFAAEQLYLTPGLSDCRKDVLMVEAVRRLPNNQEEHSVYKFQQLNILSKHELEGAKQMLYFFKEYTIEVKHITKGVVGPNGAGQTISQLSIYDFKNKITMYWNPPANGTICDVQIEETPGQEGIYYIAESYEGTRVDRELMKLYPMEDNVKIYNLMKKSHYTEALNIARDANFPEEIQSEIIKEHADKLFQQKKYDEAIEQYMQTIGFLNPSFVIQNYIQVT